MDTPKNEKLTALIGRHCMYDGVYYEIRQVIPDPTADTVVLSLMVPEQSETAVADLKNVEMMD